MSIKNNTTSLQNLLEQVNALPEAVNDVEICTFTIINTAQLENANCAVCFVNENKELKIEIVQLTTDEEISWNIIKNSLVLVTHNGEPITKGDNGFIVTQANSKSIIFVENDYRLTIN